MNKKKIIILTVSFLLIVLAAIVCLTSVPKSLVNKKDNGVTPVDVISDDNAVSGIEMYKPKPIPLEMMNDREKEIVSISTTTYKRIQVIQRNADGSVAVYRIINSDTDILTEY